MARNGTPTIGARNQSDDGQNKFNSAYLSDHTWIGTAYLWEDERREGEWH